MKIKFDYGYGGGHDKLKSIEFCCDSMRDEIITEKDIRVTSRARIFLEGLSVKPREILFCSFCGKEIERIGTTTIEEKNILEVLKNG
jgi:hypothetical protein